MQNLKLVWEKTKKDFDKHERALVDCCIAFLRKSARHYLNQGRRVYFSENNVVHWGEGDFGRLVIEGSEETSDVFGEYIVEISFEPVIGNDILTGYTEITTDNLDAIRYRIS
ncbi:MAG: hypothetical protein AABZ10_07530 [Nitrospirota bacterium]